MLICLYIIFGCLYLQWQRGYGWQNLDNYCLILYETVCQSLAQRNSWNVNIWGEKMLLCFRLLYTHCWFWMSLMPCGLVCLPSFTRCQTLALHWKRVLNALVLKARGLSSRYQVLALQAVSLLWEGFRVNCWTDVFSSLFCTLSQLILAGNLVLLFSIKERKNCLKCEYILQGF